MVRFKHLKSGHRLKERFGIDILLEARNSESKVKKMFKISNEPSRRIKKRKPLRDDSWKFSGSIFPSL